MPASPSGIAVPCATVVLRVQKMTMMMVGKTGSFLLHWSPRPTPVDVLVNVCLDLGLIHSVIV